MRRLLLAAMLGAVLVAGAAPLKAQGAKVELFGGGSFARNSSTNFGGWNASATGNVLSWLGAVADFSGHYNSPVSITTMTFGPRLSTPSDGGLAPFTQATFGLARLSVLGTHANGFGAYVGGGLDWIMRDYLAIRLMQLDAQFIRVNGVSNNGTRLSFGVVFRFGQR